MDHADGTASASHERHIRHVRRGRSLPHVPLIIGPPRLWGLTPSECADVAEELAELAACWPVGTVLERRLDVLTRRDLPRELPV